MTPEESKAKVTTKTIHELDYNDFNKIVESVYGHEFNFVADQETGNDSASTFSGDGKLDEFDQNIVDKFAETGEGYYLAPYLLNDLVAKGYLPVGDYVIEVCW